MRLLNWLKRIKHAPTPYWRRHPNPYLQLHLEVYPNYLKELDDGTYDPVKDPFCSAKYIQAHPFKDFKDIEDEWLRQRGWLEISRRV